MALTKDMTEDQMIKFIDNELLPQTAHEIENLIHPRKKTGGYFVVTRQILCMVDFLGAVYSGYPRSERTRDKKNKTEKIATSKKAIKFINAFFKPKSIYEKGLVDKLHNMYRHGLVHLYQPRILTYKTNCTLEWFIYKGKRNYSSMHVNTNQGKILVKNVNHFNIIQIAPGTNRYHLAICIDALYHDFKQATIEYRDKLKTTKYLQTNWRSAVNALCTPK